MSDDALNDDFSDVRRAHKDDRRRIGDLWIDLLREQSSVDKRFGVADDALARWHNDYPFWLSDEGRRLFVAEQDGQIIGFATAHQWSPAPIYRESLEVYINELYIVPDVRKQGFGSQLVAAVRAWAAELDAHRLRLGVLAANDGGHAFWAQHDATPFVSTMTVELQPLPENQTSDEGRRKIGF